MTAADWTHQDDTWTHRDGTTIRKVNPRGMTLYALLRGRWTWHDTLVEAKRAHAS